MRVDRLRLKDFTVFAEADFEFSPGLNVFIGANGTGKSHVLKGLFSVTRYVATNGPSLRALTGGRINRIGLRGQREIASLHGRGGYVWPAHFGGI